MEFKTQQKQYETYYLNNHGSRWIVAEKNQSYKFKKIKVRVTHLNEIYERTALFFESFGNFASVTVSIGGKKISTLNYEVVWE